MFSGALIVGEGWWGVVWGMVVFAWKFYLGPAKIVFFSSCGFSRSNKYGTFWHFALTGYFCLSLCVFISIQNIGRNIPLKILRHKVRTRELQMIYWYNSVTHRNVKFVLLVNFRFFFFYGWRDFGYKEHEFRCSWHFIMTISSKWKPTYILVTFNDVIGQFEYLDALDMIISMFL